MADTDNPSPISEVCAVYDPSLELTVDIVAAYVANNALPAIGVPDLIRSVHAALTEAGSAHASGAADVDGEGEKPSAAAIQKSITPDALISFIDGKPYKTLKRHLAVHGRSPESYRLRFGLAADYPMVASSYAAQRSALAKAFGLGRPGVAAAPEPEIAAADTAEAA